MTKTGLEQLFADDPTPHSQLALEITLSIALSRLTKAERANNHTPQFPDAMLRFYRTAVRALDEGFSHVRAGLYVAHELAPDNPIITSAWQQIAVNTEDRLREILQKDVVPQKEKKGDQCDACSSVAVTECAHGILCDACYTDIHGGFDVQCRENEEQ